MTVLSLLSYDFSCPLISYGSSTNRPLYSSGDQSGYVAFHSYLLTLFSSRFSISVSYDKRNLNLYNSCTLPFEFLSSQGFHLIFCHNMYTLEYRNMTLMGCEGIKYDILSASPEHHTKSNTKTKTKTKTKCRKDYTCGIFLKSRGCKYPFLMVLFI